MILNKFQLHLLSFFLDALLPPKSCKTKSDVKDFTDNSYYTILGLLPNCTAEEIRKAYKKKSLQYHPDKVAQFASTDRSQNELKIHSAFFGVKEAYETLSKPHRRNAYDVLGEEGAKLVNQGERGVELLDYHVLLGNLTRASFYKKAKLILFLLLLFLMINVGPILMFLKVDGDYRIQYARWTVVFVPIWILSSIVLFLVVLFQRWLRVLEIIYIMTGQVFLTLKWDETISWDYIFIFIPFYLYHFTLLAKNALNIQEVNKDLNRTVTISYLEERVLPMFREERRDNTRQAGVAAQQWCSYESLTEFERDIINKEFIIIDDPFEHSDTFSDQSMDPESKLLFTLTRSQEYKLAIKTKSFATRIIAFILSTRLAFFTLLVLKLDHAKKWNWFIIFSPILFEIGLIASSSCWTCCCHGVIIEELVDDNSEISSSSGIHERARDLEPKREKNYASGGAWKNVWNIANKDSIDASDTNNSIESHEHDYLNSKIPPLRAPSVDDDDKSRKESGLDSHSVKKQAKNFIRSAVYSLLAVVLIIMINKLNGEEDGKDSRKDYSAFWVAFPIFLGLGVIFFCICFYMFCLIKPETIENTLEIKVAMNNDVRSSDGVEGDDLEHSADVMQKEIEKPIFYKSDSDDLD